MAYRTDFLMLLGAAGLALAAPATAQTAPAESAPTDKATPAPAPPAKPLPLHSWNQSNHILVGSDGLALSCETKSTKYAPPDLQSFCSILKEGKLPPFMMRYVTDATDASPLLLIAETGMDVIGDSAPERAYQGTGRTLKAMASSDFEIGAAGVAENCSEVKTEVEKGFKPDICRMLDDKWDSGKDDAGKPRVRKATGYVAFSTGPAKK